MARYRAIRPRAFHCPGTPRFSKLPGFLDAAAAVLLWSRTITTLTIQRKRLKSIRQQGAIFDVTQRQHQAGSQKARGSAKEAIKKEAEDLLEQSKEQLANEAEQLKEQAMDTINRKAGEIVQKGADRLTGKA